MTKQKKKILVIAKAVPEPSKTHGDSVCTAGITEDGEFIRIYPVPFRIFCGEQRFSRYDWIEVECERKLTDNRTESHEINPDTIIKCGAIDTSDRWRGRNDMILPLCSKNLIELLNDFKQNNTSLGIVKVKELIEFYIDPDKDKGSGESAKVFQCIFDQDPENSKILKKIPKIQHSPHKYRYRFRCEGEEGEHDIICEDWELFECERRWVYVYETKEELWKKIHQKFYTHFKEKCDLHFIIGTHFLYKTPIIIGVYYPPKDTRKIVPLDSERWSA